MSSSVLDKKSFAWLLWLANGLPPEALSALKLNGKPDPAVSSSFKIGTAAQVSCNI
jgi:hypothetical protein